MLSAPLGSLALEFSFAFRFRDWAISTSASIVQPSAAQPQLVVACLTSVTALRCNSMHCTALYSFDSCLCFVCSLSVHSCSASLVVLACVSLMRWPPFCLGPESVPRWPSIAADAGFSLGGIYTKGSTSGPSCVSHCVNVLCQMSSRQSFFFFWPVSPVPVASFFAFAAAPFMAYQMHTASRFPFSPSLVLTSHPFLSG